jgi:hypothetical protein
LIHHLSVSARDPERVAKVLADIMGGISRPFPANYGSFAAFQQDDHGTLIEVHPDGTVLVPEGTGFARTLPREVGNGPTHFALSVQRSNEEIFAIANREGWMCRRNDRAEFPVIELWIENVMMCEILPPEFSRLYLKIAGKNGEPETA